MRTIPSHLGGSRPTVMVIRQFWEQPLHGRNSLTLEMLLLLLFTSNNHPLLTPMYLLQFHSTFCVNFNALYGYRISISFCLFSSMYLVFFSRDQMLTPTLRVIETLTIVIRNLLHLVETMGRPVNHQHLSVGSHL